MIRSTSGDQVAAPTAHIEIQIVDPVDRADRPARASGELCTRGYSAILGYLERRRATLTAIDSRRLDAHRATSHHGRRGTSHRRPDQD